MMTRLLLMSLYGAGLALAVLGIRALWLHRLPKSLFWILWLVVICRLLLPFDLPVGLGLSDWWKTAPSTTQVWVGYASVTEGITSPLETENTNVSNVSVEVKPIFPGSEARSETTPEALPSPAPAKPQVLPWIWGGVGLTLALVMMLLWLRGRHLLREALPVPEVPALLAWREGSPWQGRVRILQSDRISSPIALGLLRPRIVLPASLPLDDAQLLTNILTHEACHLRRQDALIKGLALAALCLHWFNPLAWVAVWMLGRDLELACDAQVMRRLGPKGRSGYALSLIALAEKRSLSPFGASGYSRSSAQERIYAIMKYQKPKPVAIWVAVLLVLLSATAFALEGAKPGTESLEPKQLGIAALGAALSDTLARYVPISGVEIGYVMFRLDEEGHPQYSMDEGKTWMDQEEYEHDQSLCEAYTPTFLSFFTTSDAYTAQP